MSKRLVKKILGLKGIHKIFPNKRFIFVYHDISDVKSQHHSSQYSTTPELFIEHLEVLSSLFEIVPLEQLVANTDLEKNKNYAAITFDDGFESVFSVARPILKQRNIPYAVFVNESAMLYDQIWVSNVNMLDAEYGSKLRTLANVTNIKDSVISDIMLHGVFDQRFIDSYKVSELNKAQRTYMDTDQLKKLESEGVIIGNHSSDHLILSGCDSTTLTKQIKHNHQLLTESLESMRTSHFAIPFGKREHYNKKVIDELIKYGYKYIYTTNPNSFNKKGINIQNFLFPRIGLGQETAEQLMFYINRTFIFNYDL